MYQRRPATHSFSDSNAIVKVKHFWARNLGRFNLIIIKFENTVERFHTRFVSGYFTNTQYINSLRLAIFCYIISRDRVARTTNVETPSFRWPFNCADCRLMIKICARREIFWFPSWFPSANTF